MFENNSSETTYFNASGKLKRAVAITVTVMTNFVLKSGGITFSKIKTIVNG